MCRFRAPGLVVLAIILAGIPLLTGCGSTPTPTLVPTKAATSVPATQAPATKAPTAVPATATAIPPTPTTGPTVGGTMEIAISGEPDTLDPQKTASGAMNAVMELVGGALVAREPGTGKLVPYLADSWKVSDDGLTIEFKLHAGVKFHDGTPLTAKDWAWTFNRAIDPATKSPAAGGMLGSMDKAVAVDDLTLRLTLKAPSFPLMVNLSSNSYMEPLSQAAVEKAGDNYGRSPVGVGPFRFKQWQTGTKIVLERNPDYDWGPAFLHKGPAYIQTMEYIIIPEYSTVLAGLESGDVDLYGLEAGKVQAKDLQRLTDTKKVVMLTASLQGMFPYLNINCGRAPYNDVKVRQALSYAINRSALIQVVTLGHGVPQHAPLSPSQSGYSAGMEKMGYDFDLDKAKSLLKEAGWTPGSDGVMVKDGKPFMVALTTWADDSMVKVAQIVQEQWKAIGLQVELAQLDFATHISKTLSGDFEVAVFALTYYDADVLPIGFASSAAGGMNAAQVTDDQLDKLLLATRTNMDPDKRQAAVNGVVKYMMDKALCIPLYVPDDVYALSTRLAGVNFSTATVSFWFNDAYVKK